MRETRDTSFVDELGTHPLESAHIMRKAIESSPDAVAFSEYGGNLTYINKAFLDMWGYKNDEEVLGRSALDFRQVRDKAAEVMDALKTKGNWTGELTAKRKDGSLFDARMSAVRIDDKSGNPIAMMTSFYDITVYNKTEKSLRESEERFRQLFELAPLPVAVTEINTGKFIDVNDKMCKQSKYTRDELIGNTVVGMGLYSQEERDRFLRKLTDYGEVNGMEMEFKIKDGTTRNARVFSRPLRVGHQQLIFTMVYDMTDQKRLQNRLLHAQKMEAITTLAGGIAHQFNNALAVVTGNVDLLEVVLPGNPHVKHYGEAIKTSSYRMADLTSQLLAYAQGGKYLDKILSLSNFVRKNLPILKAVINTSVNITTDLPMGVPHIKADPTQLQMVLSAVLNNAAEAIDDKGGIKISTKKEIREGIPYACLTVEDDGKGFDAEIKKRIFEPFFSTKFEGRGLGMAAVYGIVKSHNGEISIDSEPGKGTSVNIFFPVYADTSVEDTAEPAIITLGNAGVILVVEDEDDVMRVIRAQLERMGYEVLMATTGGQAVKIVTSYDGPIQMVILDVVLPGLGGRETYPLLMAARPDLKVLVCSGYGIEGPAREILNAGADGFIRKPFTADELLSKMQEILKE
jgi:PAS domain S-box-containing protein